MRKLFLFSLIVFYAFVGSCQKVNTTLTYLVKEPAKKSTSTPVLILLHGYGSDEHDLFNISQTFDKRFIIFSLRAPNNVGGYAWYKMDFLADQKFKYRYEDAKESRQKILSFISRACAAYRVDSTQVYLMGFSQGAIMSFDIALAAPRKIRGIIALSGRMLEETKSLTIDGPKLDKVKFFIGHGNADNVIKISDSEKAEEFLKTKKVADITFKKYAMTHSINNTELEDINGWLGKAVDSKKGTATK